MSYPGTLKEPAGWSADGFYPLRINKYVEDKVVETEVIISL